MSGFAGFEVPGSSPDGDIIADQKGRNEATKKLLNAMVAQAVTAAGPDPRLTDITGGSHALNYLPFTGAVEQAAGLGSGLVDAVGNLRNAYTGRNDDWHLPGVDTARKLGENFNKTTDEIQGQIGQHTSLTAPDPNSEMDQIIGALGGVAGMGIPIAPSVAGKALNLLPSVPRYVAKMLLPTAEAPVASITHSAAIAPPLVGASVAAQAADEPGLPSFNDELKSKQSTTAQPLPTNQVAAATKQGVATDAPAALPSFNDAWNTMQQPTTKQGLPSFNEAYYGQQPGMEVPMQQGSGISTTPIWGPLVTLGTTLGLLAAGKAFHSRNLATSDAARTARFTDPDYVRQAQDWNNRQMQQNGALSQGLETAQPPPLPIDNAPNKTNLERTEVLDKNARGEMLTRVLGDPTVADALAHEYGLVNNPLSMNDRLTAFNATGYHAETGMQMVPPDRILRNVTRLEDPQQVSLLEGLSAANEQDNRAKNRREFAASNPNATPTDADIRHDHALHDDRALQDAVDRMMADPAQAQIANDIWNNGKDMIEAGRRMGFHSNADAAKIVADHPHYIPEVDASGQLMHVMGTRDTSQATGVRQANTKPWQANQQHVEQLFTKYIQNDFNARNVDSLLRAQNAEPTAAKIITPATLPPNATTNPFHAGVDEVAGRYREPVVVIRSSAGPKAYNMAHPDVYNMFSGDSLKRQHILADASTVPRRLYQWQTTGPGSLVTGSVNALRNLTYGQTLIPVNAPKGSYAGLIHKGVTKATGGRWDSGVARGLDVLTTPATSAYAYGRGVVDRQAARTARWLEPGATNPVNKLFRNTVGDASTEGMRQALDNYYHQTFTAELARRGTSNTGIPSRAELPSLNIDANKAATFAAARNVPEAFYGGQWGGTKPFLFKLNQAVGEALGHLSDAGNEGWARLNKDNPNMSQAQKTIEARRLMGDPGVSGANEKLRYASGLLPYLNISAQGTARSLRSYGERPVNAPLAKAVAFGTLALIQQLTAMRSPEHMDHYQNSLSNQQHEANFQFYTHPDPNRYTAVPVAQEDRPFKALMDQLVAHATNIVAQRHDPLTFASVENMIKDFLSGHISNATWDQMKHGLADITDVVNLPPIVGHIDHYKLMQGAGLAESTTTPWAGQNPNRSMAPNQVPEGAFDSQDGKWWTKIMGAVFGLGGTVADGANSVSRYAHQAGGGLGGWATALGKGGQDWLFSAADKNPEFNMLMEHQMRASMEPPIIERTKRELKWMQDIKGMREASAAGDTTGRNRGGALDLFPNEDKKIPTDPTMLYLWQTIEGTNGVIAPQLKDIKALDEQIKNIGQQGMNPAERRTWTIDAQRRLADKYRFVHDVIEDTNTTMSKALNRPVRIGQSIKWQEGPEQFDN